MLNNLRSLFSKSGAWMNANKKSTAGIAIGLLGGLSLIRGSRIKRTNERMREDQIRMFQKHPTLWMYERRSGSKLYGQGLIERDWQLFGG